MASDPAAPDTNAGIEVRRIEPGSSEYAEAVEVRFASLYGTLGLGRALVEDTDGRTYEHFAAFCGDNLVGYARLLLDDGGQGVLEPGEARAFQVCVAPKWRGTGTGRLLMRTLEARAQAERRCSVILDAREHAVGFYERLGYVAEGEVFLSPRTGTPHVRMRLPLA